jgi:hypothetical protein
LLISLFTRSTFKVLKIGLFKGFTDLHKNIALVGSLEEISRTEKLMLIDSDSSTNIFKISSEKSFENQENYHGNISQLNEFININKITEVIFCAKDISAQNIIYSMAVVNSKKNIDFKIIPEKTQFIIGSQSIYTNETYFTTELNHINSLENTRKKRNFDIYTALILIIFSPIFGIIFKNYLKALKNIKGVLLGEKTWIGYEYSILNSKLPKIKLGVFSIVDKEKNMQEEIIDKINIIYAKDYNLLLDSKIFLKNIFKL